jgi:hypothetical protein
MVTSALALRVASRAAPRRALRARRRRSFEEFKAWGAPTVREA